MLDSGSPLQETLLALVSGLRELRPQRGRFHQRAAKISASGRSRIQVSYSKIVCLTLAMSFTKNIIVYIQQDTKLISRKNAHFVPVFSRFWWSCKYTALDGERHVAVCPISGAVPSRQMWDTLSLNPPVTRP
jgi:hypothetical protein